MIRSGQAVEDIPNCDRCLYVNLDLRRCVLPANRGSGDEETKGCDEDMTKNLFVFPPSVSTRRSLLKSET